MTWFRSICTVITVTQSSLLASQWYSDTYERFNRHLALCSFQPFAVMQRKRYQFQFLENKKKRRNKSQHKTLMPFTFNHKTINISIAGLARFGSTKRPLSHSLLNVQCKNFNEGAQVHLHSSTRTTGLFKTFKHSKISSTHNTTGLS